jgi:hypothetical protein
VPCAARVAVMLRACVGCGAPTTSARCSACATPRLPGWALAAAHRADPQPRWPCLPDLRRNGRDRRPHPAGQRRRQRRSRQPAQPVRPMPRRSARKLHKMQGFR